ncbi:MAG: hypothetical protein HXY38_12650 [Chloroflexi bacterium]|nr:hypothetical protein [Chloroflexota bacterium]
MNALMTTLLPLDMMIIGMLILGAFIAYMLYSGEIPMRWFGSIRRDARPVFYWLGIALLQGCHCEPPQAAKQSPALAGRLLRFARSDRF